MVHTRRCRRSWGVSGGSVDRWCMPVAVVDPGAFLVAWQADGACLSLSSILGRFWWLRRPMVHTRRCRRSWGVSGGLAGRWCGLDAGAIGVLRITLESPPLNTQSSDLSLHIHQSHLHSDCKYWEGVKARAFFLEISRGGKS